MAITRGTSNGWLQGGSGALARSTPTGWYQQRGTLSAFGRPAADITTTGWTASTGSDLYAMLDETSPSDSDYISCSTASTFEVQLSEMLDPATSINHRISIRLSSTASSYLDLKLMQGATELDSWSVGPLTGTPTTYARDLSGAVIDSITNYADLRIRGTSRT